MFTRVCAYSASPFCSTLFLSAAIVADGSADLKTDVPATITFAPDMSVHVSKRVRMRGRA